MPTVYAVYTTNSSIGVVAQTVASGYRTVLSPRIEYPRIDTGLDSAHPPVLSRQVPRLLSDLVRHQPHTPNSHLAIHKLKPLLYPGFPLAALVRARPRHMQRPE